MKTIPAWLYQQFDADHTLEVPGEAYGGWKEMDLELDLDRTAVVSMHAWDTLSQEEYSGWYRAVEYLPRSRRILETVFPPLLSAVRDAGVTLFHVAGGGDYHRAYPGYARAVELAGPEPELPTVDADESVRRLRELRQRRVFVGEHNQADVAAASGKRDFPAEARPLGDEGVAENAHQLAALCRSEGISHLIYAGFAVNWCLLMSPGGMLDMSRYGLMCSVFREAVTAVENKESAREERHKESALWRIALAFGFVFDVDPFIRAVTG